MSAIVMIGRRFGRLLVTHRVASTGEAKWACLCDCGGRAEVTGSNLRRSRQVSCGCYLSERRFRHGHAGRRTPTYRSWASMIARCDATTGRYFDTYGARGITVCERWRQSFEAFLEDMGERPAGTSIDRVNNDGNYQPGDCRWATRRQQAHNTRRSKLTEEQRAQVQLLLVSGGDVRETAARYGITPRYACHLRRLMLQGLP